MLARLGGGLSDRSMIVSGLRGVGKTVLSAALVAARTHVPCTVPLVSFAVMATRDGGDVAWAATPALRIARASADRVATWTNMRCSAGGRERCGLGGGSGPSEDVENHRSAVLLVPRTCEQRERIEHLVGALGPEGDGQRLTAECRVGELDVEVVPPTE